MLGGWSRRYQQQHLNTSHQRPLTITTDISSERDQLGHIRSAAIITTTMSTATVATTVTCSSAMPMSNDPRPVDVGQLLSTSPYGTGEEVGAGEMYSVTRSVYLPRIALKSGTGTTAASLVGMGYGDHNVTLGVNPLYKEEHIDGTTQTETLTQNITGRNSRQSTIFSGEKSTSSGYGGSYDSSNSKDTFYSGPLKLKEDAVAVLGQHPGYVKSIRVATTTSNPDRIRRSKHQNGTYGSGSSAATLTTIPEGQIDFSIPRPIWPHYHGRSSAHAKTDYDSLVDEAILLYTSLTYKPENAASASVLVSSELSVKEVLTELLHNVNATIQGTSDATPEDMLRTVNEKISHSLQVLQNVTEEEMRLLCINLSNSNKVSSVMRAFSNNSSSSGNSSQSCSPQWNNGRVRRSSSSDADELYSHIPSASSSSGFSDGVVKPFVEHNHMAMGTTVEPPTQVPRQLPVFVHEDLCSVPNGVRNAMIYGTLCRANHQRTTNGVNNATTSVDRLFHNGGGNGEGGDILAGKKHIVGAGGNSSAVVGKDEPKKSLLKAEEGSKPSVWEQYYGVKPEGGVTLFVPKPSDIPLFPGGRPEADFTLDVPRSELLSKRMKADKKWRCRCRLLTSFLGLVFFLLSVMAVSLILTRGKRMFGSMVLFESSRIDVPNIDFL